MALETPFEPRAHLLGPKDSHYLDVETLPWKPTQVPGIDIKVLVQDKDTGLLTALYGIGQIAGPPLVALLLSRAASRAEGFHWALALAASSLVVGAGLYGAMWKRWPILRA